VPARGVTNWDWDGMKGEWLVFVCCVTEVGGFARGVAFAFLGLRFNSQIDQQQVHTQYKYITLHTFTTVVVSLPISPQGLCIFPTMLLSLYGSSYLRAQASLQLEPI